MQTGVVLITCGIVTSKLLVNHLRKNLCLLWKDDSQSWYIVSVGRFLLNACKSCRLDIWIVYSKYSMSLSVTVERTYKIMAVKGVFLLSEPCASNNERDNLEIQWCTVTMETTITMTRTLHHVERRCLAGSCLLVSF